MRRLLHPVPGSSRLAAGGLAALALIAGCAGAAPAPVATPPATTSAVAPAATSGAAEGPAASSPAASSPAPTATSEALDAGPQPPESVSQAPAPPASACNEQPPQDFLVRGNFLREGAAAAQRAIQYRTDTYGYFPGYGHAAAGAQPPKAFLVDTTFMDLAVRMHRKVVPALKCVEEEIKRACVDHPYKPHALAGIRYRNTYRGGEVTNHIYGIAIDIDPSINTCCGCVKPWNEAPACQRPAKTEYDRMAMPECWVHAFERYGFYWLGHDRLRDTMHFEFLGDPDRIVRNPAGAAASSAADVAVGDAGAPGR
jgi:hypothetical protein